MADIPFRGQLQLSDSMHENKDRHISNLEINAEWSLVFIWSKSHPYKPEFVEIRRSTTAEEVLVSGTFTLKRDGVWEIQQMFVKLMEAGFSTMQIELKYSDDYTMSMNRYLFPNPQVQRLPEVLNDCYAKKFSIAGILSYARHKECVEGIQYKSLLDLSNKIGYLLDPNASYFSDVSVNCGGVSFSAHKAILCARSPVFAAMFTTEMKENQNNKVEITDISSHVFKTMLTYIYSGKTGELSVQTAGELLFAADKYELQDLVRVCRDYLKSRMSVENVLNSLVLGYLHDKDLKLFALDFICNSCDEFEVLEKTVEWKNLREKIPSLAMDVLTRLVISNNKELKRRNQDASSHDFQI